MIRQSLLILTVTLALGLLGCEERVVKVHNSWGGSTIDRLNREKDQEQSEKHLENLGEFLFGWVDDVTGQPKRPTATEYKPR
ncbi:MAG: hypothetical protein ACYTGQ_20240 [Planctomycetota bacterium]|jgi:hypothetical protein